MLWEKYDVTLCCAGAGQTPVTVLRHCWPPSDRLGQSQLDTAFSVPEGSAIGTSPLPGPSFTPTSSDFPVRTKLSHTHTAEMSP